MILNGLIMRFSHTIISLCIDYDAARTGIQRDIVIWILRCSMQPMTFPEKNRKKNNPVDIPKVKAVRKWAADLFLAGWMKQNLDGTIK